MGAEPGNGFRPNSPRMVSNQLATRSAGLRTPPRELRPLRRILHIWTATTAASTRYGNHWPPAPAVPQGNAQIYQIRSGLSTEKCTISVFLSTPGTTLATDPLSVMSQKQADNGEGRRPQKQAPAAFCLPPSASVAPFPRHCTGEGRRAATISRRNTVKLRHLARINSLQGVCDDPGA